jgi:single-stranded-DNA-specific exonuclease
MALNEIRRRPPGAALDFAPELHPVLRRVYAARGVARSEELDLSLDRLAPVGSLEGIERAVQLLLQHRHEGRVLVVGDFDADGATSSALVVRALRAMRFAHVDFLVPNRFRFGYGLTCEIVALAAGRRPTLIITVDNGVSSIEGVDAARALGIAVLVTDHHLPGAVLPRADVIVNPNLAGSRFASAALAGVGVAFYVMAALARELDVEGFRAADLLDLVAQPHPGGAGVAAHPRGTLRSRDSRAARVGRAQHRRRERRRLGVRGGTAVECRRPPHRHEHRDRLSARRRSTGGRRTRAATRPAKRGAA